MPTNLNSTYIQTAIDMTGIIFRFVSTTLPKSCSEFPSNPDLISKAYSLTNLTTVANNNTADYELATYECGVEDEGYMICGQELTVYSSSNVTTSNGNIIIGLLNKANDTCYTEKVNDMEKVLEYAIPTVVIGVLAYLAYAYRKQIAAKTQSCRASLYNFSSHISAGALSCRTRLYNLASSFIESASTPTAMSGRSGDSGTVEMPLIPSRPSTQADGAYGAIAHSI